jgi:hypothetical protein
MKGHAYIYGQIGCLPAIFRKSLYLQDNASGGTPNRFKDGVRSNPIPTRISVSSSDACPV